MEFSTFDVARIFGIDRTRLQTWLDKDFFMPDKKASGKGTRAVFTLNDLYRLRLFIYALSLFGSRSQAKAFSNFEFTDVGPGADQFKYWAYTLHGGEITSGGGTLLKDDPEFRMTEDKIALVVINLLAVKAEVDGLLKVDRESRENL